MSSVPTTRVASESGTVNGSAVQAPGQPERAARTRVGLGLHALGVAGHQHHAAVTQTGAAGDLDPPQRAPRQAGPRPAQPQPHAEVVGDEQGRPRVEQRREVGHGHQRHQGADGPVQRGPRVHGAGEVRRRHGAREHADEGGHAGPPTYLDGRGFGSNRGLLGQLLGRHRCRQRPELGRHVELDELVVAHRQILGVVLVHSSP